MQAITKPAFFISLVENNPQIESFYIKNKQNFSVSFYEFVTE